MQESLFETVQKLQTEEKINVEELEVILNSEIEEIVTLCRKACLKPKTDTQGNAYFTKDDVSMLKKMKELYGHSQNIKEQITKNFIEKSGEEQQSHDDFSVDNTLDNPNKKINFLAKAKNRVKQFNQSPFSAPVADNQLQDRIQKLENNLVERIGAILSEKMDGFDEIIVELIRAKTENENLRQQVNSLNKQVYLLKNELSSYKPLPFGLFSKQDSDNEL